MARTHFPHTTGSFDDPLPDVRAIAERYGDPAGEGVQFSPQSVRYRWLDLAQRHARVG